MAKRKGPKKSEPTQRQSNIFVLRGSEEFKAWMDGLAGHLGSPVTVMVERAMRDLAKREGYPTPPRRVP